MLNWLISHPNKHKIDGNKMEVFAMKTSIQDNFK